MKSVNVLRLVLLNVSHQEKCIDIHGYLSENSIDIGVACLASLFMNGTLINRIFSQLTNFIILHNL